MVPFCYSYDRYFTSNLISNIPNHRNGIVHKNNFNTFPKPRSLEASLVRHVNYNLTTILRTLYLIVELPNPQRTNTEAFAGWWYMSTHREILCAGMCSEANLRALDVFLAWHSFARVPLDFDHQIS